MASIPRSPGDNTTRRERPWILPYNRRVRHLHGITIRNLALAQPSSRPRGKTIDDDAIPSTLKTPAKALAQRESRKLEHARSSTDLRARDLHPIGESADRAQDVSRDAPVRPSIIRLRRRSTMKWSGASPLERQRKLEDVVEGRMANIFFSLHVAESEDPVYVSEEVEKAMNPNFKSFDLEPWGPSVTRLDEITIKVWAKTRVMDNHQYLLSLTASFRSLQFISKSLEKFHHPFPQNSILFHFDDGIFTAFTDVAPNDTHLHMPEVQAKASSKPLPSSSYDQLMRLSTLDDCIQDALATRDKLTADIASVLNKNQEALSTENNVSEGRERLKLVESTVAAQRKRLEAARKKRAELQANIDTRREAMLTGRASQDKLAQDIAHGQEQLKERVTTIRQTEEEILGHRRRVCEDLLKIYPIESIPGRPLAFTICGLYLPNSEFDDVDEDVTAAALGYAVQVVAHLSIYLSVPLPYPVQPRGSTSIIEDPISMTAGPRTYPLFMKGAVRYRFEYAVFLLNKDIEIVSNALGLKPLDIRHTLPNLKYLLYVATAGKGDIPERKSGGFRALLRYPGTPTSPGGSREDDAGFPSNAANGSGGQQGRGGKTGRDAPPSSAHTAVPTAGADDGVVVEDGTSLLLAGCAVAETSSFKPQKPPLSGLS
ncbi:UV radiation resistance protein and autophagy-related subunit 14-domain-containing protein [Phyllosticta paracitricarpa]|uniref:Autophagy-related protein 14 n=1 Tax=Phyllosticta paracitricarpa TaxID=2016321 RepID=A0ABR1MZY9_9PEZI